MRFNALELAGNAVVTGEFTTGNTVTCTLYNAFTGAVIPVDSASCSEIGSTGTFSFQLSNITTPLTVFTPVYWEMTNSVIIQKGNFNALGWAEYITIPIDADMCKVTALIFRPDDESGISPSRLHSELDKAYAEIQGTFYQNGKHFDIIRSKPYFDDAGLAYWILPQGSSVKFFIKQLNVNQTVTIPASTTAELNDLLI